MDHFKSDADKMIFALLESDGAPRKYLRFTTHSLGINI